METKRELTKLEWIAVVIVMLSAMGAVVTSQFVIVGIATCVSFVLFLIQADVDRRELSRLEWIGVAIAATSVGAFLVHQSLWLGMAGVGIGFLLMLIERDMQAALPTR